MANPAGTPIWFELTAADIDAAERFYSAVAGWTVAPSPVAEHGGYRIAAARDGDGIAGLMTPPPGAPAMPGWSVYFAADDVDAAAERVRALGGQIHFGPMDIPQVGRFAVAADPQGVAFTLMRGSSPEDSRAFRQSGGSDTIGHAVWVELATPDPNAAFGFYGDLFGWTKAGAMPMGPMGDYAFIGTAASASANATGGPGAVMSSALTGAPARWNWYIHVADIDSAISTAKAQGGALIQGPDQIPGGDYSANITDPAGNQIGLVGPRSQEQ